MHKNNSPARQQSQSLNNPPPPTYSDEGESDLQQRESPKPTLSTNRISKSKSQQETSFRLAPQFTGLSSDRHDQIFSSERQPQQSTLQPILTEFVGQWKQLTRPQLETISHLKEQREGIVGQQAQLKLDFLLKLWEVHAMKHKLHDVRLNIGVMQVQLETKPSTDRNKMLVLELLEKKLAKKLFFTCWGFKRLLRQVEAIEAEEQPANSLRSDRKLIQTEVLLIAVDKIVRRRLSIALTFIKKSVFIGNLFSPGSDQEESPQEEEAPQRQQHFSPSALELTLSPNHYPCTTQKSSTKRPFSFFKEHPVVPIEIQEESESNEATARLPIDIQPVSAKQISDLHHLIINLESDMKRVSSHYRQDRPAKQRELYFNRWKVAFLRKHLEATVKQHCQYRLVRAVFSGWRGLRSSNACRILKIEQPSLESPANKSYRQQKYQLKEYLRGKRFLELLQLMGGMKDTRKIYAICRQFYLKSLKTKVLYSLREEKREQKALRRSHQTSQRVEEPNYQQQELSEQHLDGDYRQKNDQLIPEENSYAEYTEQEQPAPSVSKSRSRSGQPEESSGSILTAELFRRDNLLTKTFMHFKRYCRTSRAMKRITHLLKRKAFGNIKETSLLENRLNDKLERYCKQKQLSKIFKCFMTLRRAVYGRPGRPSIEHLVKARQRAIQQKYFSVLKLLWKMRIIRQRKADRLRELHCGFRAFAALREHAQSRAYLNSKRKQLQQSRYSRSSTTFVRNLLRRYLEDKQLNRKAEGLKDWVFDRETERIQDMLQYWKKVTVARKSFNRVEDRLRRLKHTETKRKIFQSWWQQVYGTPRLPTPQTGSEPHPVTEPPSPSGEHRYWLERYYEKLLSRSDSTDHINPY